MKKFLSIFLALTLMLSLAACGGGKDESEPASGATSEPASGAEVVDPEELAEFPEECKLSEDELKAVAAAYADYLTQALAAEGYSVTARFEDDGSVHFDGSRTNSEGGTDVISDLDAFESARDCFAYLYGSGQVDLEGNLMVAVSEGVQEAVESTGDEAEQEAEQELDAESEAESDAASEPVEDGAEADADSEAAVG